MQVSFYDCLTMQKVGRVGGGRVDEFAFVCQCGWVAPDGYAFATHDEGGAGHHPPASIGEGDLARPVNVGSGGNTQRWQSHRRCVGCVRGFLRLRPLASVWWAHCVCSLGCRGGHLPTVAHGSAAVEAPLLP